MRILPFTYLRPNSIDEAVAALAKHGSDARIIAGGTDLVPRMKQKIAQPQYLVDIRRIGELQGIARQPDGSLRIGPSTPLTRIAESPEIRESYPALAEAAARVGSTQLRNVGTLGGNVCLETRCWYYNQSQTWKAARPNCYKAGGEICHVVNKPQECYAVYRGDTAVALIALGATARVRGPEGQRTLRLEQLFTGKGESPLALGPGDLLTDVMLPASAKGSGQCYVKIAHRAVDFPLADVSTWLIMQDGRCKSARIVLGAVGSGPVRAREAEEILVGRAFGDDLVEEAAQAVRKFAHPVRNVAHGSPSYRRHIVTVAARRAIQQSVTLARGGA